MQHGADSKLNSLAQLLESYSYKGVLERGFVLVRDAAGAPVLSAEGLSPGDGIALTFQNDGQVAAMVDSVAAGAAPTRPTAKPAAKKPVRRKAKAAAKPKAADDPQGSLL